MIYLINNNTDPALNHAIEEYFMLETKEDVFTLWRNRTSLLLGRNQDAYQEIDIEAARENDVEIVRRLSGGGTVFCDLNNMQYTFITSKDSSKYKESFEMFARPVVDALKNLGLNAEFTGRNDIIIDGKKVSGNAQARNKDRVIHHGTLLFDVNLDLLKKVIHSRPIKFQNKAVKSVSSRVGTIKEYVKDMDVLSFMNYLSKFIIEYHGIDKVIELDDEIIEKANKYLPRFKDPEWNLGKDYSNAIALSKKYDFGLVEYKLIEKDGIIREINVLGDYFQDRDISLVNKALYGVRRQKEDLEEALKDIKVEESIKGMTKEIFIEDLLIMGRWFNGTKETGMD